VETREQLDLLRHFGCDMAQGYLLGRPASQDAISHMLACAASGAAAI
jgi:EAL domain-containing protein (putative c-di-GMP-specific phosphodiesterase class I)